MAKDRRKLQHIHSSIPDRQPTPQTLEVGEIAVNNAAEKEFISLKNTDNKVVRISSDEQMVTWMEKKEIMPYSGTVDNVHLDTNRSNIEIKLNQVVAKNTAKYDVVNGAKDIDGNDVNPSSDGGLTNGAGFAIDMSRYAMNGANPSFSSITVTHQSNLNGATNISDGAGGSRLKIKTTDVDSINTNWTETIKNHTSNVTIENENAVWRTTVVGTENLTVSGTTTEQHTGDVIIRNGKNVGVTTYGNDYEDVSGITVINHSGTTNYNYTGATTLSGSSLESTTTGNTTFNASVAVNISGGTEGVNITGATNIASETTINNNLNVTGNTNVGGNLNVTGNTKITGTTDISGATNIDDDLTVTGKANVSGATTIGGVTTINNNLNVTGNTNTIGNTNVGGNLNVTGTTEIGGDIYFTLNGSNVILQDVIGDIETLLSEI